MHVLRSMQGIVGAERYNFAIRQDIMDTTLSGRTHIKIACVHKGDDDDTEHVFIKQTAMFLLRQSLRGHWQTATKVSQRIDGTQRHRGRPEPHEGRTND